MATVLAPPAVVLSRAPSAPATPVASYHRDELQSPTATLARAASNEQQQQQPQPETTAPQPRRLGKSESEPTAFPVPVKPKRVRSVSATLDVAAVSVPKARLIAHDGGQARASHAVYDIHVKPLGRISGWDVHRRFSNFVQLHDALLAAYPHATPPPPALPPKRWFGSHHPSFIEKRRAALEVYLEGLLANETLRKSKEVRVFLGLGGAFGLSDTALPLPHSSSGSHQPISIARATATAANAPGSGSGGGGESALFSFPYAGGSFAGNGGGRKLGGKKKGRNKGRKVGEDGARDAWTDLVVVTKGLASQAAAGGNKAEGEADAKQDGGKQRESVVASAAVVAPSSSPSYCSVM